MSKDRGRGRCRTGTAVGRYRTVDLEQLVIARLSSELLGVDDGLLEGIALGGRHGFKRVGG